MVSDFMVSDFVVSDFVVSDFVVSDFMVSDFAAGSVLFPGLVLGVLDCANAVVATIAAAMVRVSALFHVVICVLLRVTERITTSAVVPTTGQQRTCHALAGFPTVER